jgi:photosystem II stability/assembly factor-like uncharacterized protein
MYGSGPRPTVWQVLLTAMILAGCAMPDAAPAPVPTPTVDWTATAVAARQGKPAGGQQLTPPQPTVAPTPTPLPESVLCAHLWAQPIGTYAFADSDHGWLAESAALLATTNGGRTWQRVYQFAGLVSELDFVSRAHGWAAVKNGCHTVPGGYDSSRISFASETLYATQDGGASWTLLQTDTEPAFGQLRFVDAQHGWAAGVGGLRRTDDGGLTWTVIGSPCVGLPAPAGAAGEPGLGYFSFGGPASGYLLCTTGGKNAAYWSWNFRTTDAGQTWELVSQQGGPLRPGVSGLFFLDRDHGWRATGPSRAQAWFMRGTEDGGDTWPGFGRLSMYGGDLTRPRFVSPSQGYVLSWQPGRAHRLLGTRDGGESWDEVFRLPQSPP